MNLSRIFAATRIARKHRPQKAGRLPRLEALESRALLAADLGDPGFHVPDNANLASGAETSLIHEYDPATRVERFRQGSLGEDFSAAETAARDAGFDGLAGLLKAMDSSGTTGSSGTPGGSNEFIFGADDRVRVGNTLTWPYAPIGRLWMNFGGGNEASCSGVMISPYHVLTAGHCINGVNGGGWANDIAFSAAQDRTFLYDAVNNTNFRRSELQFFGESSWSYARSYTAWTQSDDYNWDLAVVTLDRRIGDHTGWFGYGYNSDDSAYNSTATTAGYPGDLTPNEYDMWTDSGNARNNSITTHQLRTTDIDIWPGQSGSPVWYGGQITHGIVSHQSYTDNNGNGVFDAGDVPLYNAFTRITQNKFNDIGAWINEDNGVRPPTDRADFVDYDAWFNTNSSFMNSSFITAGGNFSATAYPRNNGTATAGNHTVSFYASTNTTISTGDYFLGNVNMGNLNAFSWETATLNVAFPASVPAGSYYVGWIIDSGGNVAEYLEGNNTGYIDTGLLTVGSDDHGNNAATATRILADSHTAGNLESAGDTDWFFLEASAGAQITLATTLGTLGDSIVRLYAPDGVTQLAFDDDGGPGFASLLNYTIPAQGTYYVSVEDFQNNDPGSYILDLTHVDDHGDNIGTFSYAGSDLTVGGDLEVGGDVDYFRFEAVGGTQVTLSTTLLTMSDSILRVYDSTGTTELAFDDDGGPGFASLINFTVPADGSYFVVVEDFGTPNPGTYQLSLTHSDDHGDDWSVATAATVNTPISGVVEVNFDLDAFSFQASAGVPYTLTTTLGSLGDTVLYLYDTDGATLLDYNDDFGGTLASRIDWTAPGTGTYYAYVGGFSVRAGSYSLLIAGQNPVDGDFNDDGQYNCTDVNALVAAIASGGNNPAFDLTGDSLVNVADRDAWLTEAGAANLASGNPYRLGDANLDGVVDGSDFGIWNSNKFTSTPAWCSGDFNVDGFVDGSDFGIWNANKFTSSDSGLRGAKKTPGLPTEELAGRFVQTPSGRELASRSVVAVSTIPVASSKPIHPARRVNLIDRVFEDSIQG